MLKWSIILLVVAIIAAIMGFAGLAGAAADLAQNPVLGIPDPVRAFSAVWTPSPLIRVILKARLKRPAGRFFHI
jgi:hypothetical protein